MAVAGLLAQYMSIKTQLSYNQLQQTRWNDLATTMEKKLSQQESYQSKWEDATEKVDEAWGNTSTSLVYKGQTYLQNGKGGAAVYYAQDVEVVKTSYANAKVPAYDPDKLDEYTDLDMEYETMQNMYDTLCTTLESQAESMKEQLGTEAQDTHMLGG